MSPWPLKKESGRAVPPELPRPAGATANPAAPGSAPVGSAPTEEPPGSANRLGQLLRQLAELAQVVAETKNELAAEVARHEAGATADRLDERVRDEVAELARRFDEQFDALRGKLDRVAERVDRLAQATASAASGPAGIGALGSSAAAPAGAALFDPALFDERLKPLAERLDQIDAKLQSLGAPRGGDTEAALAHTTATLQNELSELRRLSAAHQEWLASALRQLHGRIENGLNELVGYVRPAPEEPPSASPADEAQWQRAIVGPQLAAQAALGAERRQLLADVLEGNGGAMALAGQLLVFQSSPPERMAQQLKEIGEAFYRWQPKTRAGSSPMEDALVQWLRKCCEDAGIGNVIEPVQPGERFDSSRHTTDGRGVEITEVRGWVVLRDNGKVYTKAAVGVR